MGKLRKVTIRFGDIEVKVYRSRSSLSCTNKLSIPI